MSNTDKSASDPQYHDEVVSKCDMFDNVVKLSMTDCYNNLRERIGKARR